MNYYLSKNIIANVLNWDKIKCGLTLSIVKSATNVYICSVSHDKFISGGASVLVSHFKVKDHLMNQPAPQSEINDFTKKQEVEN